MALLGLRFCARAFSSYGERGPLFIAVRGPLTIAASLVAEHRLQTRRLSSCGSRAQLLHGMWDLPRPGLEPVSPALAGGLSTTAPPGKPSFVSFYGWVIFHCIYVPHLLYPFICRWTLRLLPCPGYCKQSCNEHCGTWLFLNYGVLRVYAQYWDCWFVW